MTLFAVVGTAEDRGLLGSPFEFDETRFGQRLVWLGKHGPWASSHDDGEISVVCESDGSPSACEIAVQYRRQGLATVSHFTGAFAFVLHDRQRRALCAATDGLSRVPVSYWYDRRSLVLSTSVLSVLAHPRVRRELDELYLAHLITGYWCCPEGSTALRDVKRLVPGTALVASDHAVDFVSLDDLKPRGPRVRDKRVWVEAFWADLESALQRSVRLDECALSLSGGLDSATIASAMTGLQNGARIEAFSMVAAERKNSDERDAIDQIGRALGPGVVRRYVDCSDAVSLETVDPLPLPDDPVWTPLCYLPARLRLWACVRQAGFRGLVDGDGGDELFSMLTGPVDALAQGSFRTAWSYLVDQRWRRAVFVRQYALPFAPAFFQRAWVARLRHTWDHLPSYLTSSGRSHPAIRMAAEQFRSRQIGQPRLRSIRRWSGSPMIVGARATHRHLASAYGVKLISPLLDRRMVEFVLGIPAAWMIHSGGKPFLRDATINRVPPAIRTMPKDIRFPIAMLRAIAGTREIRRYLDDPAFTERLAPWISFRQVKTILNDIANGSDLRGDYLLWQQTEALLVFAYWYGRASRQFGLS